MRKLIAPMKHGIPAMTYPPPHGDPSATESGSCIGSLRLPGKTAGLEYLIDIDLPPGATPAINGALLGHLTAGRASAPAHIA